MEPPPRGLLQHPMRTAALGAVVGLATVAVLIAVQPGPPPPPPRPSSAAAAGFLQAWRAHLLSSWSVDQVLERATTAGATLRTSIHEAQRPPDRVRIGGAAVDARRGSTVIACAIPPGAAHPVCRSGPTAQTWAQEVDAEIALLSRLLSGARPVFAVTDVGRGCYDLTLQRPPNVVPVSLGRGSEYCLDPATGAVLRSRVQRIGAVDTVTTTEQHAPARDEDLALPADAVFR